MRLADHVGKNLDGKVDDRCDDDGDASDSSDSSGVQSSDESESDSGANEVSQHLV